MCKVTQAMIVADGAAVGSALDKLGVAVAVTDPSLGTSLETAGNDIVAATQNFQTGDTLAVVDDAENAAIVVLDSIPVVSVWAPLVAIAFTALNLLIANSKTQSTQTGNAVVDAHALLKVAAQTQSPWQGKAKISHNPLHSMRKNFENAWNEEAPKLGVGTVTV